MSKSLSNTVKPIPGSSIDVNGSDLNTVVTDLTNALSALVGEDSDINASISTLPTKSGNNAFTGNNTFSNMPSMTETPTLANNLQLVHKKYVDDQDNLSCKLTGTQTVAGTKSFTGQLNLSYLPAMTSNITPFTSTDLVPKKYVDDQDNLNCKLSGAQTFSTGIKTFTDTLLSNGEFNVNNVTRMGSSIYMGTIGNSDVIQLNSKGYYNSDFSTNLSNNDLISWNYINKYIRKKPTVFSVVKETSFNGSGYIIPNFSSGNTSYTKKVNWAPLATPNIGMTSSVIFELNYVLMPANATNNQAVIVPNTSKWFRCSAMFEVVCIWSANIVQYVLLSGTNNPINNFTYTLGTTNYNFIPIGVYNNDANSFNISINFPVLPNSINLSYWICSANASLKIVSSAPYQSATTATLLPNDDNATSGYAYFSDV